MYVCVFPCVCLCVSFTELHFVSVRCLHVPSHRQTAGRSKFTGLCVSQDASAWRFSSSWGFQTAGRELELGKTNADELQEKQNKTKTTMTKKCPGNQQLREPAWLREQAGIWKHVVDVVECALCSETEWDRFEWFPSGPQKTSYTFCVWCACVSIPTGLLCFCLEKKKIGLGFSSNHVTP